MKKLDKKYIPMTIAKIFISFVFFSIIIQSAAFAIPKINGVQTVDQGDTETYTISGVSGVSSVIWAVDGGTITTNNVTNIVVNWTVAGNKNISASVVVNLSLYDLDLDVVVNSTVPDTPPTPTKGTTTCGSTPLHRVGSIPSGETWYWQTSSTGTSTASAGNTYNVTSDGTYYLRAKNAIGWSTATSGVYVNVNESGLGGTISGNGSGFGSLSGTLTLSGSRGTRAWQKKVGSGAWTNIGSSGTSISYNITQTTKYRVKVTNGVCSLVYSSEKSNIIYPVPSLTSSEGNIIGLAGTLLSITGTNSSPQWVRNGSDISGATQTTLNIFEPGSYQVRVTTGGKTTTSVALVLTAMALPGIPSTPTKGAVLCGMTPLNRVGSVPSGETWYWQTSSTGTNTANSGNSFNATSDGTYYLRAANGAGWGAASSGVYVNVSESSLGGTISGNESGYGSLSGTLTLSGSHGTRVWQKKVGNGAWTNMGSSGTSISYNITQTTKYRVKVTNGVCSPVYSSEKSNTVYPVPVVTSTENGTIGFGGAALSITGTSSSPQWLRNGSDISGATQTTLNIFEPGSYQVRVTTGGKTTTSDALILTNPIKSQNINYVRTINILEPDVFLDADLANVEDKNLSQSVNYYDGLGRPTQNVQIRTSAGGYDIVQHMAYDAYGRQPKSYLPYSGNNTGAFQDEAEDLQVAFYNDQFDVGAGNYAFAETEFENSPRSRVEATYAPGQPWANALNAAKGATGGGGKPVSFNYQSNDDTDKVIRWEINKEKLIAYRFYEVGTLYKNVTTDENTGSNEGEVIEYKDKQGRVVLKQVKEGADDYLETYYIYDDFGNLSYVLPPVASASYQNADFEIPDGYALITKDTVLDNSSGYSDKHDYEPTTRKYAYIPTVKIKISPTKALTPSDDIPVHTLGVGFKIKRHGIKPTQDFLDTWAFQYKYDERQRMVEKRVPGADWVYMVYDARDRLVLTQDGNQRSTANDGSGKAWSFTKYDVLNRPVLTGVMNYALTKTRAQMQVIVNDFYVASTGNTDQWYEESSLENDAIHDFTDQSFPKGLLESDCYTVTYYDNYTHTKYKVSDFSLATAAAFNDDDTKIIPAVFEHVKGQVMGTKIKIGDTDQYIETTNFYDDRNRLIQSRVTNQKGGTDVLTTQYDFASRLRKTYLQHSNPEINSTAIAQEYTYDHAGRLKTISHEIEGTNEKIIIVSNTYNELGELESKQLADDYEQVNYSYNIRGWLTKINDLTDATTKKFEMDLKYDDAGQYNGNIGAIDWKNPYEAGVTNSYDYSYDRVNRLTGAAFSNGSTMDFDVPSLTYDGNGNILTLQREGNHDDKAAQLFDHLDYDYNGNQLMRVTDNATQSKDGGFKDGNTTGDDYAYDANGNMIVDKNKGITNIEYNHLNLPKVVTMSTGTITYTYDAAGTKLSQQVAKSGENTKVTDYMGGFIYEKVGTGTSELQFAQHDEGRIVRKGTDWEYQYHLKDHLGNVRTTFKTETESDVYLATLEDGNPHENLFERHDEVTRIKHDLFDHTDEGSVSTHSILLDGSANRKIGLAKSLMVKPGDVIDLEVYAKYFDSDAGGLAAVLNTLASNLASSASGVVIDGVNAGNSPLPFADFFSGDKTSSSAPEAYLNYFVFDQNYDFISSQSGFKQVGTSARETGSDVDHQKLSHSITIEKAGFVYIYLSNDDTDPFDVFFDDFKVTQHHTDIVSKDDYYPFGMSFASYSRPAGTAQNFKYNGNEVQEETGWYDFYKRTYDPTIGRFLQVDPYADLMQEQWTPYHNSANNPVNWSDPDGDFCVPCVIVGIIGYVTASLPANAPSTDEDANDEAMKKANDAYGSQVIGTTMIVAGMAMDYANSPDETPANPDGNDNPYDENGPTKENAQELENQKEAPVTDEIYKRPNNATNPKQRKSVQGKPCVTCGADDGQKNVADHKKELVKEHYETGTIDKDRMKSEDAVQPQCEDCSRKQGGEMSGYSKKMKKIIKERTQ